MSSIATAPSRNPDKDGSAKKQLRFLNNPDAPPTLDSSWAETGAAYGQATDEASRVERLLNQLEARSMALVPYGYGNLREVPAKKSNSAIIAGVIVAVWVSTLILGVAYLRLGNHQVADRAPVPTPIILGADPQEQKVASSVDHLAKALVTSSERMNELQAAMERSNRDLQRLASKVSEKPKPAAASPRVEAMEIAPNGAAGANLPKNWHQVLDVKPSDSAVPHRGADGLIDYWLVPRGAEKSAAKVLPIGTSPEGVVVHSIDDGKDYTLTPNGEWRNGAMTTPGN